jgi:hypothetical protein
MIAAIPFVLALNAERVVARVGPVVQGLSMNSVRRLLGAGTAVSTCGSDSKVKPGDCPVELDYGDGSNLLKVEFGGADSRVISVKIDLGARQSHVATARVSHGAFARWTWEGNRIDRLPTSKAAGWSGTIEPPHKDCFVSFQGPARASGAQVTASYQCAAGTSRVAEFSTGVMDP